MICPGVQAIRSLMREMELKQQVLSAISNGESRTEVLSENQRVTLFRGLARKG